MTDHTRRRMWFQPAVVVSRNRVLFHRPLCPSSMDACPDTALERVDPAAAAYMIYTSGSTGRPKAC